jgi:hypothetical protein
MSSKRLFDEMNEKVIEEISSSFHLPRTAAKRLRGEFIKGIFEKKIKVFRCQEISFLNKAVEKNIIEYLMNFNLLGD